MKSALRDWFYESYGMICMLVISRYAAPPYPAAPDFPPSGGQNKSIYALINRSMLSCRDMAPWLSIHSPTTKWGEGGGASHQRGGISLARQGGCKGFIIKGRLL